MEEMYTERLAKFLFTTSKPNEKFHRCVVVFDSKRAISFQHGSHSSFEKGTKLVLYNVMDLKLEIPVCFKF